MKSSFIVVDFIMINETRRLTNAIRNCRVLPALDAPAHSNAKLKTINKTTVTVD